MNRAEILRGRAIESKIGRKHAFNQARLKDSHQAEIRGKLSKKEERSLRKRGQ